ncbi:asparaginase/glutaminase [Methyloglobulus morosus KoM1]|uniref:Asparaginase/glutaminase n=1 Tax=Methyloglobulus morosus KoM1 TaxID=1116472 RepID=V5BVK1_9GAMM|nr:asparaginase domain-containing protein [Methyloglobulus morosus]ESS71904.1 asparaginase/glutaminase [Methyloglobulus morosus KoM1]
MKKILLVFTGGTIGSAAANGTIRPSDNAPYKLLHLFQDQYGDAATIQFETLQPIQILSENLAPAAWKIIIEAIESAQPDKYDGIIVTHGTDTLAYTAAALSFYFGALALPVLLVSSDYPLDNPKANGLANFICAVEFIKQHLAVGVFVPYRNAGQAMQIHLGSRLTCSLQLSGDFYSVQGKSLMLFDGQHFTPVDTALIDSCKSTEQDCRNTAASDFNLLMPTFSSRILMVKPYPGLDYSHFNLTAVDAVLHDLYHSGTACSTGRWGEKHSLLAFITRCRDNKIPVYLAPAIQSENAYQSTRELIGQGAETVWDMSIEAAYVKLMLAYGNFTEPGKINNFLHGNIAFEHI